MKPEEQIKALAELDGFKTDDTNVWCRPNEDNGTFAIDLNYFTSYNAIIPLIQKQTVSMQCDVITHLIANNGTSALWMATPSQLCKALLRATGKWKA